MCPLLPLASKSAYPPLALGPQRSRRLPTSSFLRTFAFGLVRGVTSAVPACHQIHSSYPYISAMTTPLEETEKRRLPASG